MRLKEFLKGMTYRKLARKTGYTEGHLNAIANGRSDCTTECAKKIAKVLGVSLDELLKDEPADQESK